MFAVRRILLLIKLGQAERFAGISLFDPNAQVKPGGLSGNRVGVGPAQSVTLWRQEFMNDVVEQKAPGRFRRAGRQGPGTLALADGIPGPQASCC